MVRFLVATVGLWSAWLVWMFGVRGTAQAWLGILLGLATIALFAASGARLRRTASTYESQRGRRIAHLQLGSEEWDKRAELEDDFELF